MHPHSFHVKSGQYWDIMETKCTRIVHTNSLQKRGSVTTVSAFLTFGVI